MCDVCRKKNTKQLIAFVARTRNMSTLVRAFRRWCWNALFSPALITTEARSAQHEHHGKGGLKVREAKARAASRAADAEQLTSRHRPKTALGSFEFCIAIIALLTSQSSHFAVIGNGHISSQLAPCHHHPSIEP